MAAKRAKWMERRAMQGYSYDDVVAEINRRVLGEYHLHPERSQEIRKRALREVGVLFRFSALVHNFLEREGLTPDEFFAVYHDDSPAYHDFLERCMSPFSDGGDITCDDEVDMYYPGSTIEREM